MIKVLDDRARRVLNDLAPGSPDQAADLPRVVQVLQEVGEEFLALALADAVRVGAMREYLLCVHGREHAAEDDRCVRGRLLQQVSHAAGGGVGGRRKERKRNHVRPLLADCLGDVLRLHLGVAGVEHPDLVAVLAHG